MIPTVPGGAVSLYDAEQEQRHVLDLPKLKRGLRTMIQKYPKHWAMFVDENYDANTGDVFLQCAVFGEVIYG